MKAAKALTVVRAHWTLENNLHWSLDVVFREDDLRARKDNARANLALIDRAALNIINAIGDPKSSKRRRLIRCAWESAYLEKAIAHMR
jgi:predicted transposase YbfD/YdcC